MTKRNPLLFLLGISFLFFIIFLIVLVKTLNFAPGGSRASKKLFSSKANSIGILEVRGAIMDSKKYLNSIEDFEEDNGVKGVIVHLNSPGGAVAPSQEIYDALRKLNKKKPVFASMSSVAASGGYYLAVGTRKIFANPGTITGSIGVIMPFADMSGLFQWAKVKPYNIKTGKYKDLGSTSREMTPDEKKILQDMIDNVLEQFRKAVAEGRNLNMQQVIAVSDGRIFSGEQAKQLKLVDELGGFTDAVQALAKETGIEGKPNLIYSTKKKKLLERLFEEEDAESEASSTLSALLKIWNLFRGKVGTSQSQSVPGVPLFLMPNAVEQ